MSEWQVEHSTGAAHDFHHRDLSSVDRPSVWVHRVERPALVLGSSQRADIVDRVEADRLGIEVCQRRSGGGLVLVDPSASCWVDVLIPPSSPRWDDDVNRAFHGVGDVWLRALESLGVPGLSMHTGSLVDAEAGRFLCFAGLGPGEIVQATPAGPSKVVGLSQRRQRNIARFQGLFVAHTDLALTTSLVDPGAIPHAFDSSLLRIGLDRPPDPDQVADAVVRVLCDDLS
ncbi:MAG: lipoyl protein ligase domain-containing protein [Ilumatobacter sp.]|uniref:lipoyl protein ligase domain-containing protein n=1 Tax=Ilumatobacter sp. TaxID=1967498 RepID=UPI00391A0FBD